MTTQEDVSGDEVVEAAGVDEAAQPVAEPETGTPVSANTDGRHFNCSNCGSNLLYKPGTENIKCPYCGTINAIPAVKEDSDYLHEQDFLDALVEDEKRGSEAAPTEAQAISCTVCGATTTLSPDRTSERCPYCGSPLAIQNQYGVKLNVQAVLPFIIEVDKAMQIYRDWIKSRWFAPNDFSRRATREKSLDGIYMPYWTYDADTRTSYTGERGVAYYVTERYTVTNNGKTEQRTRQVRRIRWSPVSGVVDVAFDDVLVPASKSLPVKLVDGLEPWKLSELKPFRQEYLSGFITETYQVSLKDGFTDAKRRMEPSIRNAIRRDIGGDEQRIHSTNSRYDSVTFKHILLPLWLSAYAYGGTTYRFTINAQTGEVSGERPWSYIKIGLAVAAGLAAAYLFIRYSGILDNASISFGMLLAPTVAKSLVDRSRRIGRGLLKRIGLAK